MTIMYHDTEMATYPSRADNSTPVQQHDDHFQSQRSSFEIPPSPTLTNPDMILPHEGERQSSTPSPPFQLFSKTQDNLSFPYDHSGQLSNHSSIGIAVSAARGPPRSQWTYERHVPGRPLSDIGEEDIPSSPRASWTGDRRYLNNGNHHESDSGSCSSESSSTISVGSEHEGFSHGPRAGDGSNRSSQLSIEHIQNSPTGNNFVESVQGPTMVDSGRPQPPGEESSSVILSSEAERILENAKKRLSLMEGNLTRARSSLRISPSPSPAPSSHGTSPSSTSQRPAGELYRSISRADRKRASLLRPRSIYNTTPDGTGNNHSRGHSESNIPFNTTDSTIGVTRSLSALDSTSASKYSQGDGSLQYNLSGASNPPATSILSQLSPAFDIPESGIGNKLDRKSFSSAGSGSCGVAEKRQLDEFNSIDDSLSVQTADISRASSQTQVRDLRDQVEDLKNKISSLQKKAQEGNLRRRSQQSLQSQRTPSPFTAAEQWYTSAMEYRDGYSNLNSNAGYGWSNSTPSNENASQPELPQQETDNSQPSGDNSIEQKSNEPIENLSAEPTRGQIHDTDEVQSVLESHYEDAEDMQGEEATDEFDDSEIDRVALNEILSEPLHDDLAEDEDAFVDSAAFIPPDATPHEEREDAFDYENFFLHSAMGSFMRNNNRRTSVSSVGSVETTRPISPLVGHPHLGMHARKMSSDSVSTSATFATATEGWYEPDDSLRDDYEINTALQVHPSEIPSKLSRRPPQIQVKQSGQVTDAAITPRDLQGSVTPVSAFVSTFISSASAISTPTRSSTSPSSTIGETQVRTASPLTDDDTRLLEKVFQSLGKVCEDLQGMTTTETEADPKVIRTLRRRLDAARRVLEGQLDP